MALTDEQLAALVPGTDAAVVSVFYRAALEAIDLRVGGTGVITEWLTAGAGPLLMLSRPADGITAVVEDDDELAADDHELSPSGRILRRLHTGTNPRRRWRGRVEVSYLPLADGSERDRVAIELVRLDVNHNPGVTAERLGDWSQTYTGNAGQAQTYAEEREDILGSLSRTFVMA